MSNIRVLPSIDRVRFTGVGTTGRLPLCLKDHVSSKEDWLHSYYEREILSSNE